MSTIPNLKIGFPVVWIIQASFSLRCESMVILWTSTYISQRVWWILGVWREKNYAINYEGKIKWGKTDSGFQWSGLFLSFLSADLFWPNHRNVSLFCGGGWVGGDFRSNIDDSIISWISRLITDYYFMGLLADVIYKYGSIFRKLRYRKLNWNRCLYYWMC